MCHVIELRVMSAVLLTCNVYVLVIVVLNVKFRPNLYAWRVTLSPLGNLCQQKSSEPRGVVLKEGRRGSSPGNLNPPPPHPTLST